MATKKTWKDLSFFQKALVIFVGIILGLFLIGIMNAPSKDKSITQNTITKTEPPKPAIEKPENQQRFEKTIQEYVIKFSEANNELQQSTARKNRAKALQNLGFTEAYNWVGTLTNISTDNEGNASVSVKLTSNIKLHTSYVSRKIKHGSPLYNKLSDMEKGQRVNFSGSFIYERKDYFNETSMFEEGGMKSPDFSFDFTSVSVIE